MALVKKSGGSSEADSKPAQKIEHVLIERIGNRMVDIFILVALFVLGATIVWSAVYAYINMLEKSHGTIEDILLLFIYLELGAMVGIYFRSGLIPAQFLIFVAITVLTRLLASVTVVDMSEIRILVLVGAIVLLCGAILILRYADSKYGPRRNRTWLS
jgi:phosphate starvation-inducible membrane PsiE